MKRVLFALSFLLATVAVNAQRRHYIQNMSDFSAVPQNPKHRIGTPGSGPLPIMGTPKVPVILVQFPDRKFTVGNGSEALTQETYDKHFNGTGIKGEFYKGTDCYGAISEYFESMSDGKFKPNFGVYGPITLDKSYTYYGKGADGRDTNIGDFYREACAAAEAKYSIDWTQFDNNNDGRVDFVFFIYAGVGENSTQSDPDAIWPKEQITNFSIQVNGKSVTFGGYGCTNEIRDEKMEGIGTACHELSHALGLPDMYDIYYQGFGMEYFDVMDAGSYPLTSTYPCAYSAYERDFMRWRDLVDLDCTAHETVTLYPMTDENGVGYRIHNPLNENEYFIFENRQNEAWDSYFCCDRKSTPPTHGLMITHIDYNASMWGSNRVNTDAAHQRINIVPADGTLDSYYAVQDNTEYNNWKKSVNNDLYPGPDNHTEMSSYAVFTGGAIPMTITNIKEEDGIITFNLNGGNTSAIRDISNANRNGKPTAYDLTGRKVRNASHGIYIINGKKYVK